MKCYEDPECDAVAQCANCGGGLCADSEVSMKGKNYCRACLATGPAISSNAKNPGVAAVINFLFIGFGQI